MRLILASARGLLGGWLLAHTLPLLIDHHVIVGWQEMGFGDGLRVGLATIELLGAALFAFEKTLVTGFALLLISFLVAGLIHLHHGQLTGWLLAYTVIAGLLVFFSRRAASDKTAH